MTGGAEPGATPPPELFDAMNMGLYLVDRQRRITVWNAAAERITGYTAQEVIGHRCGEALLRHVDESGELLCGARCPLMATMRDGAERAVTASLQHKDGHQVPVRISAGALRDTPDGPIVGAVETFHDDSAAQHVRHRLVDAERRSMTDALTGVGNRRRLEQVLAGRFSLWRRHDRRFSLVLLDIDRFKDVNDVHGHDVGDRMLQLVGRTLAGVVRAGEDVVRYGGEEFVVVSGAHGRDAMHTLSERLRDAVQRAHLPAPDGATLRVTVSAGATDVRTDDDPASLLRRADRLMLAAKQAGRDRVLID